MQSNGQKKERRRCIQQEECRLRAMRAAIPPRSETLELASKKTKKEVTHARQSHCHESFFSRDCEHGEKTFWQIGLCQQETQYQPRVLVVDRVENYDANSDLPKSYILREKDQRNAEKFCQDIHGLSLVKR